VAQELTRAGRVGRVAPDPGARDAHRAEAEPEHLEVAAEQEGGGVGAHGAQLR